MRIIVVFPAPFLPIRPKMEPSGTSKEAFLTAIRLPNDFVRFITLRAKLFWDIDYSLLRVFKTC